jgi:predicted O-methyltransferase YrrM
MSRLKRWIRKVRSPPDRPLPAVDLSGTTIDASIQRAVHDDPAFAAYRAALESGVVIAAPGLPSQPLTETGLDHDGASILYYLVRTLDPTLTIETGFGLGTSAIAIMLAKRGARGEQHIAIDPARYSGVGDIALLDHLNRTYGKPFRRVLKRSEIELPELLAARTQCDFAFIDGNHHFDGVLLDFFYLDRLLRIGGLIVMDDIDYPAVEAAVNYIRANRSTYAVAEVGPFAVLRKLARDDRSWGHFRPFEVPDRRDWTHRAAPDDGDAATPPRIAAVG